MITSLRLWNRVDKMGKVPLCQCINCHEVLIDTNPQVNAKLYDVSKAALNELVMLEDEDGYFKGCPNCMTDGYLTDDPPALQ